jgi:hypothetical protein
MTIHVLGTNTFPDLPVPDPEASVELLREWLEKGIPEFGAVTTAALLALNLYSLANNGRTLPDCNFRAQASLLERLFKRKGSIMYGFFYIVSMPIVGAYYARDDVQKTLGFDVVALKEEAERRVVSRTASLPKKEPGEELAESAGNL